MMSYLEPHFEHDIFVSYSQGDPSGAGDSPLKSWTEALVERLRADIQSVDTEFDCLHFWIDAQLDPTAPLTDELRGKVKSSGILLVVMSPRYLMSKWCKDELEWFREQVRERSNDQGRVFVIRVLPTKTTDWPDFLRDEGGNSLVGFLFHDPISKRPYGWRDVSDEEYVRQLWTLQTALTKRLREIRERCARRPTTTVAAYFLPQTPSPQPSTSSTQRRVYVHARGDLSQHRSAVQQGLAALGIAALGTSASSGTKLVDWTREAKARFEMAKRCDALVLVLADSSEPSIAELFEIGVDERERIQAARGTALPCAVLDLSGEPPSFDLTGFGIKHFDMRRPNWPNEFDAWLKENRGTGAP
jgi:hypothetical protein